MPSVTYGSIPTDTDSVAANPLVVGNDAQMRTGTQLQTNKPGHGTLTVLEVASNLVNAIVGAGILGLPFALREAGFWGGLLVSVWVGVLTHTALYMLVLSGMRAGIYKYAVVAEHVLGRAGFHLTNFMLFFQSAGSVVGYLISEYESADGAKFRVNALESAVYLTVHFNSIVIGDTIPVILGLYIPSIPILANRQFIIIAISVLFVCIILSFNSRLSPNLTHLRLLFSFRFFP